MTAETMQTQDLTGRSIIAGESVTGAGRRVNGYNPATNEALEPEYSLIDEAQLATATSAAAEAFETFSQLDPETHAAFLEKVAENIEAAAEPLTERVMAETGLPQARVQGERGRTVNQLRLFASVIRQGDFRGTRWDTADPERKPLPKPDVRQRMIPLGPVAVFGASNFPLAFSVAGGDTASALAAGCPVVFKAHNAHPGTSEIVGTAITAAVRELGLHPGVFSLIYGPGASIGQALASDPAIKAVGFTGSRGAGISLMQAAAAREVPIPVYAEMSSINPVFFFNGLLEDTIAQGDQALTDLGQAYLSSVTGSSGQLCTAPGLVFVPSGAHGDAFLEAVADAAKPAPGQTMLTQSIAASWNEGVEQLSSQEGVALVGRGTDGAGENAPAPVVFQASTAAFRDNPVLHEEIFGAASLVIRYDSAGDLVSAAQNLEGQLTATLHLSESDHARAAPLIPVLEGKVGRILANGWPTGVEVNHSMVHGGPFPATSDSRSTSVGTRAIERFLRPVAYQNLPESLLPAPVKTENPWKLNRRVNGTITLAD
ncbi:aldehyde dehydrogenase (NADP(+)) [Nesterenkonia halotolerans]|uniref:NADP-dependent aldehyde dehydrogenase n=1 Tax=Nesterenkonia halotolerans TaxID=225325 RepID=A0ABR9J819_9MICC|nr:aldehyde dehydrogenase (NADP(+)) [Nesterenkonia halotolerans]MBE1515050.1 NADP-dependent aldehyde dehydrogenase [Nesterenkonia halotolerans]